jgi:hypothetical protein
MKKWLAAAWVTFVLAAYALLWLLPKLLEAGGARV